MKARRKNVCPVCQAAEAYQLGDGRRKCRQCGRRYTPRYRRSRLASPALRQLALCFWQMVPARQAARVIGLDRKTVQRHYRMLRVGIGGAGGEGKGKVRGEGVSNLEQPLVALVADGASIQVFPYPAKGTFSPPLALVYPRSSWFAAGAGLSDLQLWLSDAGEGRVESDTLLKFWGFAGRLAKMYRGRNLQELPLFLQEVGFRFNQRDNPQVIETLCGLLGPERGWG